MIMRNLCALSHVNKNVDNLEKIDYFIMKWTETKPRCQFATAKTSIISFKA